MRVSRIFSRVRLCLLSAALSFVVAFMLFSSHQVFAQATCTLWRINFGALTVPGEPFDGTDPSAVCSSAGAALVAYLNAGSSTNVYHLVSSTPVDGGVTCRVVYYRIRNSDGFQFANETSNYNIINAGATECPPTCAELSGTTKTFSGSSGGIPASICSGGCAYEKSGIGVQMGGQWAMPFKASGQSCSSTPSTPAPPGEKCITGSSGMEYCHNPTGGGNCGFVNGEFVCLKNIKNNGCKVMSDGSRVCGKDAGTPPVPDNGTPGIPATPDQEISAKDSGGTTYNYNFYSSTTVGGSSRDPGSSGAPQGSGQNGGNGTGSGVTDGDGEGEDDGEGIDTGDGSELSGFGQCMAENGGVSLVAMTSCASSAFGDAWDGLTSSPLISAITGISAAMGTPGACPSYPITIFGETHDLMEFGCSMMAEQGALLQLIAMVIWSLFGIRIVLST